MAIKTWDNATSDNWNVSSNWIGGLPGATDEADITLPFLGVTYTVDITDTESVGSIRLGAANANLFVTTGSTLNVGTLVQTAGTLELWGVMQAGTVQSAAAGFTSNMGTLVGAQWDGVLALTESHDDLEIAGGLTLRDATGTQGGELDLSGDSVFVHVLDDTTIDGTGSPVDPGVRIRLGSVDTNGNELSIAAGHLLTLGPHVTVSQDASGSSSFVGGDGTIINHGTIIANGTSVSLGVDPGTLVNAGSIAFNGGAHGGVSGLSVTNTGTISVSGGGTISLFANGATIANSGVISVTGTNSLLQMQASTSGAGRIDIAQDGTASVFGVAGIIDLLDPTGFLVILNSFSFAGTIEGFSHAAHGTIENTIELTNAVGTTTAPYVGTSAGGTLTVEATGGLVTATLDLLGDYTHDSFAVQNVGTNTFITTTHVACFAAGTRILTTRGEVPVEFLTANDLVVTLSGAACKPIRWIGRRRIDLDRHPAAHTVAPIRVLAGAFADGVPHRDLLLSPDHAVLVRGSLVPVRHLVNGATIRRDTMRGVVTYYHVELDTHAVLLAEGLPAESYLDTGNRSDFEESRAVIAPSWLTTRVLPAVASSYR